MQQATHPTARVASPDTPDAEREAYRQASAVMDGIVAQLPSLPRSAAVIGDLIGFRVRLNFGTNDPSGIRQFAEIASVNAVVTQETSGAWLEARAIVDGIEVCAEVLLSSEAAAAYEASVTPAEPADVAATVPLDSTLPLATVLSAVGAVK